MARTQGPDDVPRLPRWARLMLAALMGWNLMVTAFALEGRDALAEGPSCPALGREVDRLRKDVIERDRTIRSLNQRLRRLAASNIRAVERAFAGTGITVSRLIARGRDGTGGEALGGPFIPAAPPMRESHPEVERWESLWRVIQVLPLGAPLAGNYRIGSGFGMRRDPINRRRAMHEGIDLVAPLRTPVLAAGPGRVSFVGRKAGYGLAVEIDHGLGVTSRYAHLAAVHVQVGQVVPDGRRLGLLGNTGRTTGPHLHYEVEIDGKVNDPRRFIRAGGKLKGRWRQ